MTQAMKVKPLKNDLWIKSWHATLVERQEDVAIYRVGGGVGKSSYMHAVLDIFVVPMSGPTTNGYTHQEKFVEVCRHYSLILAKAKMKQLLEWIPEAYLTLKGNY